MISVVVHSVLVAGTGWYIGDSVFKPGRSDFGCRCSEQSD